MAVVACLKRPRKCENQVVDAKICDVKGPFLYDDVKNVIAKSVKGGQRVAKALHVNDWVSMVRTSAATPERDRLIGVSVTLAARLLGISRARVHQLLRTQKLRVVDVYDERRTRIGHMVTLASIERRRRTVKPRRTQWNAVSVRQC
jgi:hypothetical protein